MHLQWTGLRWVCFHGIVSQFHYSIYTLCELPWGRASIKLCVLSCTIDVRRRRMSSGFENGSAQSTNIKMRVDIYIYDIFGKPFQRILKFKCQCGSLQIYIPIYIYGSLSPPQPRLSSLGLQVFIYVVVLVFFTEGLPGFRQALQGSGWDNWSYRVPICINENMYTHLHIHTCTFIYNRDTSLAYYIYIHAQKPWTTLQDLSFIEFFAGQANVFAEVKKLYGSTALDIEYLSAIGGPRSNAFDILTASGLALLSVKVMGKHDMGFSFFLDSSGPYLYM